MAIATYCLVAVDCPDPSALAEFYAGILGGEVERDSDSQQLHLDLRVPDIDAAEAQVLALGATPLDLDDQDGSRDFRVYADPAGHPFCLVRD